MEKLKKLRVWITITVIAFVFVITLFSPIKNSVSALYGNAHAIAVFLRFESDVMQKSPAGRYYKEFIFEHSWEQYQIVKSDPEHLEKNRQIVEMFIPGVEALINGEGDTVRITDEQINSLKAEWDWESPFASQSLREDVEKELQRFPLEHFIGMTFSEALDYVNSNFPPDLATPESASTSVCLVGIDPDCQSIPYLVTSSDGQWAYYVLGGMYFEYPSTWRLEQRQNESKRNYLDMVPAPDSPESNSFATIILFYLDLSDQPDFQYDPLTYPRIAGQHHKPIWKRLISFPDFTGSEFLICDFDCPSPFNQLQAVIYDPNTKMLIEMDMQFHVREIDDSVYSPEKVQERFPNFQHILESLRYWKP